MIESEMQTIIIKKNYNRLFAYHLIPIRMFIFKKMRDKMLARMQRKETFVYCWWECKLVQPLWKTVWRFLKKTNNGTTIWSSNPTSGYIYPKELKSLPWGDVYPPMFIADLFTIHSRQDMETIQVSIHEWMDRENVVYTYTMEYYSANKKRRKSCHLWQHG